jgi:hypothetical protein
MFMRLHSLFYGLTRVLLLMRLCLILVCLTSLTLAQSLKEGDDAYLPALQDSYQKPINLADIPASRQWLVL